MYVLFERSWDENHYICPFWRVSWKSWKILRVDMVLGDAVSKLEKFVWILNHIARSITWFLYTLKASQFFKWPISTWSFMWWCQFIDWLKFKTRPCSLLNLGTANATSHDKLEKISFWVPFWFPYPWGLVDLPQVDLMNFRVEYVRPRGGRWWTRWRTFQKV